MGNSVCRSTEARKQVSWKKVLLDGVQEMGVAGEEPVIGELLVKGRPCVLCLSREGCNQEGEMSSCAFHRKPRQPLCPHESIRAWSCAFPVGE